MNPYSLSGLLIAINSLALGLLVYFKNPDKNLGRIWFLFTLMTSFWGLGVMVVGSTSEFEIAALGWKISYVTGVIWISPLFYHFVCIFLNLQRKKSIRLNYALGGLFVLGVGTPAFFKNIEWTFNSLYYVRAGWLYGVYFAWWLGLVAFSHWDMIRVYPNVPENKKRQIKYFFLATAVGYSGGVLSYLPKFSVDIYPWGNFLVCLYPLIMGYAILKYNLLDIRIFIRRTGLLIFIYTVLLLASMPILMSLNHDLVFGTKPALGWLKILGVTGVMTLGPVFYAYLVRQNQYFQEKKASGLTHELKSPLAAIQGALETIKSFQENRPKEAKMEEYLDIIDRSSIRMTSFVNELLHVFNLQNAKDFLDRQNTNMNDLVQKVTNQYRSQAQLKGLNFECRLPKNLVVLMCDGPKIEIVISNLLSNAVKFTENGAVTVTLEQNTTEVSVSVEDTGPGIDPKDLPHIFEPFYQGKAGKGGKGSGIGLTIAKAWVEAHGGKISVRSNVKGKGTKIFFVSPNNQTLL